MLDSKLKDSEKQLRKAVSATGTGLLACSIGPVTAARLLGDVVDVARFATRGSPPGTAPHP